MKDQTKELVRQRYAKAAKSADENGCKSCCGKRNSDPITVGLYEPGQAGSIPEKALLASLGCGNPTALAELCEGEIVLDLGSGGGIDVLLSAKRVGRSGFAYGLDMTDEMLALANKNKEDAQVENVEFLKGDIEDIPLPDESVDVIISNCVINLSGDKDAVIREAFRVLKPGGRFAVADMVTRRPLPDAVRRQVDFWTACLSGALVDADYVARLESAGFVDASIQPIRTYSVEDAAAMLVQADGTECDLSVASEVAECVYSGFIRARKQ